MRTKLPHRLLALLLPLLLAGCGSFLEEYSQDTDYVRTWQDLDELLIGDCYMPVQGTYAFSLSNSQNNYGTFLHLVADEMQEMTTTTYSQTYDQHEATFGYFTWQQRAGQNEAYSGYFTENRDWTQLYKLINVANNVLASVTQVPQTTEADLQGARRVQGEAHFLRGFYYFWLVNCYGPAYEPATAATAPGVPLKTTPEVIDRKFQRNSVQEVYAQVLADLHEAERLLGQQSAPKKSIYRADSTAVHLLLSRVHLYMQQWDQAARYARRVVDSHPALQDITSKGDAFMTTANVETLFSMGGDDVPAILQPNLKGMKVADALYRAYSTNDYRKTRWFWTYAAYQGLTKRAPGSRYAAASTADRAYYHNMYSDGLLSNLSPLSSLFWLRSAEAYLNLAEAQACMGNEAGARAALLPLLQNRYNAKAPEMDLAPLAGTALVERIRQERRLELVLEGHRWFDLRRYRVCAVHPQRTSITHDYTYYVDRNSSSPTETHRFVLTEDDVSWTLPIPFEVLQFNTGMEGNGNLYRTYTVVTP